MSLKSSQKSNHKLLGQAGEALASQYLSKKGYSILHQNFRTRRGELDIIAKTPNNALAFIEVKSSQTSHAGAPEGWVGPNKIRKLQKLAQEYCSLHNAHKGEMQFDVIGIDFQQTPPYIHHIPNAFLPHSKGYY